MKQYFCCVSQRPKIVNISTLGSPFRMNVKIKGPEYGFLVRL
jgi:hypothetical protein